MYNENGSPGVGDMVIDTPFVLHLVKYPTLSWNVWFQIRLTCFIPWSGRTLCAYLDTVSIVVCRAGRQTLIPQYSWRETTEDTCVSRDTSLYVPPQEFRTRPGILDHVSSHMCRKS